MDKILRKAADIDELQYRIHCASELVRMVHTAMTDSSDEPCERDFDGLFGAYLLLNSLENEMHEESEKLHDTIFKAKKDCA